MVIELVGVNLVVTGGIIIVQVAAANPPIRPLCVVPRSPVEYCVQVFLAPSSEIGAAVTPDGRTTTVDIDPTSLERRLIDDARHMRKLVDGLRETGADFHHRGWSLGTSSNYSVVLGRDPLELLITASGKDKGRLTIDDFVCVDDLGRRIAMGSSDFPIENRPSAETMLHVVLAALPRVGAVLHTHSVWGTLLSARHAEAGEIVLSQYEMLKGLAGITTHDAKKRLAIFPNTQDIAKLSEEIARRITDKRNPLEHGFLMAQHGLYAWGSDLAEARRHIEVLEFLLECEGRRLQLN